MKNNIHAIQDLIYKKFYTDDGITLDDKNASSHWDLHLKNVKVIESSEGQLRLNSSGFGENTSRKAHIALLTLLAVSINLLILKDKVRLIKNLFFGLRVVRSMGLIFSQDCFRQVCTFTFLQSNFFKKERVKRVLIIGDGFGVLSAMIHAAYPDSKIYLVDLGAVLFFQAHHLGNAYPQSSYRLMDDGGGLECDFNFVSAGYANLLPSGIDLGINIASMQEMAPSIINNYFDLMRKIKVRYFYCCNRVEKNLPGGELVKFKNYGWSDHDVVLIDEICPWHKWYLHFLGAPYFHPLVPFFKAYDGVHWHRLSQFN
jgi:putative sugar O-methyltransferase